MYLYGVRKKQLLQGLDQVLGGRQNLCVEPCGSGASSLASAVSGEKGSNMGANYHGIVLTDESTVLYCSPTNCHEDYGVECWKFGESSNIPNTSQNPHKLRPKIVFFM